MNNKGSASLELAVFVPVVALFLLIAFQFSMLLSGETLKVARAHAKAMEAIRSWEEENAATGFTRPCLEMMEETRFVSGGTGVVVGVGQLSQSINSQQEVSVVREPICIP